MCDEETLNYLSHLPTPAVAGPRTHPNGIDPAGTGHRILAECPGVLPRVVPTHLIVIVGHLGNKLTIVLTSTALMSFTHGHPNTPELPMMSLSPLAHFFF